MALGCTKKEMLEKAAALAPELHERAVAPVAVRDAGGEAYEAAGLAAGDAVVIDFGEHLVGHVSLDLGSRGSHPDAPAWLRVGFAERLCEFDEKLEEYHGWISRGWIQSEEIRVDELPCVLELTRRYAFRYVRVEVVDVSSKYQVVLRGCSAAATTSADADAAGELPCDDGRLRAIDRAARATLRDCMQDVFEDGPKRDRRLWIGDLRLEALANYRTFGNNDLVKRCLYLFGGTTMPDGRVSQCVFTSPEVEPDDRTMFDYALLFVPTLLDYWRETGDEETLRDLAPVAFDQVELAREQLGEDDVVRDSDVLGWCFIDWSLGLNKQASAQGVYCYCLAAAVELARAVGDGALASELGERLVAARAAGRAAFCDEGLWLFVSGEKRQVSWASQVWMVLGGVVSAEEAGGLLDRVAAFDGAEPMVTPYLWQHYVDALLVAGRREQALQVVRDYWGGMIDAGADTFWELYNPDNPDESPYGGTIVNSYCHAWSCGPAYFLREAFVD